MKFLSFSVFLSEFFPKTNLKFIKVLLSKTSLNGDGNEKLIKISCKCFYKILCSWLWVIYWLTIQETNSSATSAYFGTKSTILSTWAFFPCAVCFTTSNIFQQLWWCIFFGHLDWHYSLLGYLLVPT